MKVLKEYNEPTTIIITGDWVIDKEPLIKYTDGESIICIKNYYGECFYLETYGMLTILTEEEFYEFIDSNHYKMHCDGDENKEMFIVIKDFYGKISGNIQLKDGNKLDKWDENEYIEHQLKKDFNFSIDIEGDYSFKEMTIKSALKFLNSNKTSKMSEILSEETKNQLFNEIDNEGLGYWVRNYGYKGDEDDELVILCKKIKKLLIKLEERLNLLGVEI